MELASARSRIQAQTSSPSLGSGTPMTYFWLHHKMYIYKKGRRLICLLLELQLLPDEYEEFLQFHADTRSHLQKIPEFDKIRL